MDLLWSRCWWCYTGCSSVGALSIHSVKPMLKAVFNAESSLCLSQSLSCLLIPLSSLFFSLPPSHTYGSILHGQWRTAQFSTRVAQNHRTYATQSFSPLTIQSSSHVQTHSHSTDHSLIQSHANIHGQLTICSSSHIIIKIILKFSLALFPTEQSSTHLFTYMMVMIIYIHIHAHNVHHLCLLTYGIQAIT